MITFNYVKSNTGDYAVQLYDDYGYFAILTDDQTFPQGHGWSTEWSIVDPIEIPPEIRKGLDKAIEGYLDYNAYLECVMCEGDHDWFISNN